MIRNLRIGWKLTLAVGGLALALSPGGVPAQTPQYPIPAPAAQGGLGTSSQMGQLKSDDYEFVVKASQIDREEVQMGELAQRQGGKPAVRSFGERMVNDHSKSSTRLQELATQRGAALPTQMSHKDNAKLQRLERLSGGDFDRAFAEDMVKGHEHAIKEYKSAAKDMSDAQLRTFAETSLPILQEHLRMAKNLEQTVKKEK
jgi:putative membrane protein